jgi:hypothetical protein
MWTDKEFANRALGCWDRYTTLDSWFTWGAPKEHTLAALKMYRCASQGTLGLLLLGDAKIRQDQTLVRNFGLASGSDSHEKDDQKVIDEAMAWRQNLASKTSTPAVPVSGRGAILNDIKWSPMLNDSFILGGVHRGSDFHLALQDFHQFDLELQQRRQAFGPAAPQYAAAPARGPEYYQQKWKLYLIANPEVLWNSKFGIPRIFARELMGLKTFGYTPAFTAAELGFVPRYSGAGRADFEQYLLALGKVGFPAKNKARILSAISEFLFGDANSLN